MGYPDGEQAGDAACLAVGLAIKCVADAAQLISADPSSAGFVHGLRHRLSACFQYLRETAYRRGVRDAVRAAIRDMEEGRRGVAREFFQKVLELLAAPPSSAEVRTRDEGDLSTRAMREVKAVGMQPVHVVTWNIAGQDSAESAPTWYGHEDKLV